MKPDTWIRAGWIGAFLAGSLDFGTGLGLVLLPAATLALMGVPPPAAALPFVRFVGAFVGAVGGSYLWAVAGRDLRRLRHVFEFTLLFRAAAGTFTAGAVATGMLAPAWLMVTATDFALVGAQVAWLRQGLGRHE